MHSNADTVLKYGFSRLHPGHTPVGIQKIFADVPDDVDGSLGCKKAHNINSTRMVGGHHSYTPRVADFSPKIPWLY